MAKSVGSNPALDTIFASLITGCGDHDPIQATRCMVVEPTLCVCMCIYVSALPVCNCKH